MNMYLNTSYPLYCGYNYSFAPSNAEITVSTPSKKLEINELFPWPVFQTTKEDNKHIFWKCRSEWEYILVAINVLPVHALGCISSHLPQKSPKNEGKQWQDVIVSFSYQTIGVLHPNLRNVNTFHVTPSLT